MKRSKPGGVMRCSANMLRAAKQPPALSGARSESSRRLGSTTQPWLYRGRLGSALMGATLCLLACSPSGSAKRALLVGKWQSSRLATPLILHVNGEWEIKQDDGLVLQYGLWDYQSNQLIWTVKQGKVLGRDINPVVSLKPEVFTLRENDRSITTFTRLDVAAR